MNDVDVLSQTYPARIRAVEALLEAANPRSVNADSLRLACEALDAASPLYGRASTAVVYAAFAELVRIAAMLVDWRNATLNAVVDTQRFIVGAKERQKLWRAEYEQLPSVKSLIEASSAIESIQTIDQIGNVCEIIARVPLPVGVFADEIPSYWRAKASGSTEDEIQEPTELSVAFLRFSADGTPANEVHFLAPNQMHDLDVEVRVSRWPEGARLLRLSPVSVEPASTYEFPTFEFPKPLGDPPYQLSQKGRAVLKVPQALQARPYEFRYTASFDLKPTDPVMVVGQRNLRIEAFDLGQSPITGYREIDEKLVQIRDRLRKVLIRPKDLDSVLLVLACLGNLAGRALQGSLFEAATSEADFQIYAWNELKRKPEIGAELEAHPESAGGVTDLSFHGIRIELKYDDTSPLGLPDCMRFLGQTAMYAVGTGKHVGVLCVLDNSPKSSTPFPAADGIEIIDHPVQTGLVYVVTILIQGNLPLPSALSR
jgi:hypothetical protein